MARLNSAPFVSLLLVASALACGGEHQGPGVSTEAAIPEAIVEARANRQAELWPDPDSAAPKQILFGDLHVHTTFSPDAFMTSLPMMGGSGLHPPADACDFARLCADLDFWSINDHAEGISPLHWNETIDAIQECNARGGDPQNPDSVAFLGWEWSQVGSTPETHYGHKNVIFLETDRSRVPRRPIAAPRPEFRVAALPAVARAIFSAVYFSQRSLFADYQTYYEEVNAVPYCPADVDPRDLPPDCHEVAADPSELHEKLDAWGTPSIVIPHGTSWGLMTPRGFSLERELASGQHDPDRQLLLEIYSGHGSAEPYRDWPGTEDAQLCPAPSSEFLACCWQAGEIIRSRCDLESGEDCDERAEEARRIYLEAGAAGHLTVPGADVDDWLDCDQCRDCFSPAFSHRPGGSAQAALAMRPAQRSFDSSVEVLDAAAEGSNATAEGSDTAAEGSDRTAYRFGFIGASDTHDARAGNGFKEFARLENTEALSRSSLIAGLLGDRGKPEARARPVKVDEVPLGSRRDIERGSSFLVTGGLAAVHADSRRRESIWSGFRSREVYATSGERILLWFDLLNAPGGKAPMGRIVRGQTEVPRFRVSAAGAFEQKPGCPEFVERALTPERLEALCLGECYNPSDRRRAIRRIEVVRIRPQTGAGEPLAGRIEDPWLILPCEDQGDGCRVEFDDPDFRASSPGDSGVDGETIYYVRAIQEPTLAVNAGGFRCDEDAEGNCLEVHPCYGDDRTDPTDDCLAEQEERAWSSPIFVR